MMTNKKFYRQGDILFEKIDNNRILNDPNTDIIKIDDEERIVARGELTGDPRKGKNHYNWKGGEIITHDGYIMIRCEDHPKANKKNRFYLKKHRIIMEQHLGRYLTDDEEIHHINGNKQDNRIENLKLLSKSEHTSLHMMGNKHNVVDTSDRKCIVCKSDKTYQNPITHVFAWFKTDNINEYECKSCHSKEYKQKMKEEFLKNNPDMKYIDSKTVALGEITNHSHAFTEQAQVLLFHDNNNMDPTHVQILEEQATITHQEHAPITLEKGLYKITREREYNPFVGLIQRSSD